MLSFLVCPLAEPKRYLRAGETVCSAGWGGVLGKERHSSCCCGAKEEKGLNIFQMMAEQELWPCLSWEKETSKCSFFIYKEVTACRYSRLKPGGQGAVAGSCSAASVLVFYHGIG